MKAFVPTLYYYTHCPYCVRVLTFSGLFDITLDKKVLLNDDEHTPIKMVGKKMVPILETAKGQFMGESLDIINYLSKQYQTPLATDSVALQTVEDFLSQYRQALHGLSMPRWVKLPLAEFATTTAIEYFTDKKTAIIGDFDQALSNTATFSNTLENAFIEHTTLFEQAAEQPKNLAAIVLFSALQGISAVKEFAWPAAAKNFMLEMSQQSGVKLYHQEAI